MAKNEVAKQKISEFGQYFTTKARAIQSMLPKHMNAERVAKIAISALMRNPTLMTCKPETVWLCVANAATLGLEINLLGAAYLVPFRNKNGGTDCQLIIGYQGLIDLARRSGNIESIEAHVIHENDDFDFEFGLDPRLVHRPNLKVEPGKVVAAYAVAKLKDGGKQIEVMTKLEIDKIRARSKAKDHGPWVSDYEEMAKKTVVRRLCKYLPKSIELAQALTIEEAAENGEPAFAGLEIDTELISDVELPEPEKEGTNKLKQEMKEKQAEKTAKAPANDGLATKEQVAEVLEILKTQDCTPDVDEQLIVKCGGNPDDGFSKLSAKKVADMLGYLRQDGGIQKYLKG